MPEMINLDNTTNQIIKEHNTNWPQIPEHSYRILTMWVSGSGKTNSLFNLIHHQPDIDKIYLYAKDPYEGKYQLLLNKHFNDSKAFIENSNDMDNIHIHIEEYNPNKKQKLLLHLLIC